MLEISVSYQQYPAMNSHVSPSSSQSLSYLSVLLYAATIVLHVSVVNYNSYSSEYTCDTTVADHTVNSNDVKATATADASIELSIKSDVSFVTNYTKCRQHQNIVEVCLSNIASIDEAIDSGCTSIELCVNRMEGGCTPSIGLIEETVRKLKSTDILLHVLVRPREGGFVYDESEFDIIVKDVLAAKAAGADGIVVGFLSKNGSIDVNRLSVIRAISAGMVLTFHRAFDHCDNQFTALEDAIRCGCDRILTSGYGRFATNGINQLSQLVRLANNRISIVAAAGIDDTNVAEIISKTNAHGIHCGSSSHIKVDSLNGKCSKGYVPLGLNQDDDVDAAVAWTCVCKEKVSRIVSTANSIWKANSNLIDITPIPSSSTSSSSNLYIHGVSDDELLSDDGDDGYDAHETVYDNMMHTTSDYQALKINTGLPAEARSSSSVSNELHSPQSVDDGYSFVSFK